MVGRAATACLSRHTAQIVTDRHTRTLQHTTPNTRTGREAEAEAKWAAAEARVAELQASARQQAEADLADERAALR